jgi:RNA polymerase sigma-70 factor (family 1)
MFKEHTKSSYSFNTLNMGDEKVFDHVFRTYYAALCSFAQKYLLRKADAEDVVGNLFVSLWNREQQFENDTHARASLYRAIYNACFNHIRSSKRIYEREELYSGEQDINDDSFMNEMLQAELIRMIYNEFDSLPPHYSTVMKLSYQDGLKNEEIANMLGLSVQTVKNYKSAALKLLRSKLPKDAFFLLISVLSACSILR